MHRLLVAFALFAFCAVPTYAQQINPTTLPPCLGASPYPEVVILNGLPEGTQMSLVFSAFPDKVSIVMTEKGKSVYQTMPQIPLDLQGRVDVPQPYAYNVFGLKQNGHTSVLMYLAFRAGQMAPEATQVLIWVVEAPDGTETSWTLRLGGDKVLESQGGPTPKSSLVLWKCVQRT